MAPNTRSMRASTSNVKLEELDGRHEDEQHPSQAETLDVGQRVDASVATIQVLYVIHSLPTLVADRS